jgi:hypothetical protein
MEMIAADFNLYTKRKDIIKSHRCASEDAFFNFVEQDSHLSNKGKYEANAALSPLG